MKKQYKILAEHIMIMKDKFSYTIECDQFCDDEKQEHIEHLQQKLDDTLNQLTEHKLTLFFSIEGHDPFEEHKDGKAHERFVFDNFKKFLSHKITLNEVYTDLEIVIKKW